jgi:hypothetical protein
VREGYENAGFALEEMAGSYLLAWSHLSFKVTEYPGSLFGGGGGVELDALHSHLVALFNVDCQHLFDACVWTLYYVKRLDLLHLWDLLQWLQSLLGQHGGSLLVEAQRQAFILLLLLLYLAANHWEIVLLLLLHELGQLLLLLIAEGHSLGVFNLLLGLVLWLLLLQRLQEGVILLDDLLPDDPPALSVYMLKVLVVLDGLEFRLSEDAA